MLDPTIVRRLVSRPREAGPLAELTERERETHIRPIFTKLGLEETPEYHRRVVAVLTYLRQG